jgi:RNA:NAD 2'-phosphotransferase (TPT1/KptA family)
MSYPANANRAASADAALVAYMFRTSCDCEDCLADLLCDLMHWADKCRFSFAEQLYRARYQYSVQMAEEEAA